MTEEDKTALKEFLQGAGVVVGSFVALIVILLVIINVSSGGKPLESQSTQVVGTYKECDIIQWHYGPLAEYKYFLYCEKNK
jgi:hypothetical protein